MIAVASKVSAHDAGEIADRALITAEGTPYRASGFAAMPESKAISAGCEAAAAYVLGTRATELYAAQIDDLSIIELCVRSPALGRAIRDAVVVKARLHAIDWEHGRAGAFYMAVLKAGPTATEKAAAEEFEREHQARWDAAWDILKDAAIRVIDAPFHGLDDLLYRCRAYLLLLGTTAVPQPSTDCEEDHAIALDSIRRGVEELIGRGAYESPVGDAASGLAGTRERLRLALDEEEGHKEIQDAGGVVEAHVLRSADARRGAIYAEKAELETELLSGCAPDLDCLVMQMETVFELAYGIDVHTYAARAHRLAGGAINASAIEGGGDTDAKMRALAQLVESASFLRDQSMSADWHKLMDPAAGMRGLHENAADAIWRACDSQMDPADLVLVRLDGAADARLPVLVFNDSRSGKTVSVSPDRAYRHGMKF